MKKFSFPKMRNRQFAFEPKKEYVLTAERSEAASNSWQFPKWCSILELVRTHFAAAGGEEAPREKSERRRLVLSEVEVSRTTDNFKFFFGGIQSKNSQSEYLNNTEFL